jgi:hypothetical protein
MPPRKTDRLLELLRAGEWAKALALANTFRILPPAVLRAIRQAHAARSNPRLYRGMGRNPETLVEAGKAALTSHYGERL